MDKQQTFVHAPVQGTPCSGFLLRKRNEISKKSPLACEPRVYHCRYVSTKVRFEQVPCSYSSEQWKKREEKLRRRAIREEIQRECAKQKLKFMRTKQERAQEVVERRRAKFLLHYEEDIDLQAWTDYIPNFKGFNQVSEKVGDIADKLENIVDGAASTIDVAKTQIKALFDSFCQNMPRLLVKAAILSFLLWILERNTPHFLVKVVVTVASGFFVEASWKTICDMFSGIVSTRIDNPVINEVIQLQSGLEIIGFLSRAVSLLAVGTAIKNDVKRNGFSDHLVEVVSNKMAMQTRVSAGYEDTLKLVIQLLERGVNVIRSYFSLPAMRFIEMYSKEIDTALHEVILLEQGEMNGGCAPTVSARLSKLLHLYHTIRKYQEIYRWEPALNREFESAIRTLQKLITPLRALAGEGTGYKPLPLSLVMYGAPGVGKTLMVQALVNALMVQSGEISMAQAIDAARLIFVKPFNTEYMDGYCGQPVYLMDDYMLKKATANDGGNGFTDLMTFYSCFTTLCNMAACDNKGMFPFSSKVIMMTTNLQSPGQAGANELLLCPQALVRRVDVHYEVCVRPDYRLDGTTKLDYYKFQQELAKCTKDNVLTLFPWHIWELFPASWAPGVNFPEPKPGTGMPFIKLILESVQILKERASSHTMSMDMCDAMLKASPASEDEISRLKEMVGLQSGECPVVGMEPLPAGTSRVEDWISEAAQQTEYEQCSDIVETESGHVRVRPPDRFDELVYAASVADTVTAPEDVKPFSAKVHSFIKDKLKFILQCVNCFFTFVKTFMTAMAVGVAPLVFAFVLSYTLVRLLVDMIKALFRFIKRLFGFDVEQQSNLATASAMKIATFQSQTAESASIKVFKNTYKLLIGEGDCFVLGQILFLQQDYFCYPSHYIGKIKEALADGRIFNDTRATLKNLYKPGDDIDLTVAEFLKWPRYRVDDADLCIGKAKLLSYKSRITHLILKESDLRSVSGMQMRMDSGDIRPVGSMRSDPLVHTTTTVCGKFDVGHLRMGSGSLCVDHTRWFVYKAATRSGDCGGILSVTNGGSFNNRVICGLHVGGRPSYQEGYAQVLTQELLEPYLRRMRHEYGDPLVEELDYRTTVLEAGLDVPVKFQVNEEHDMPIGTDTVCPLKQIDCKGNCVDADLLRRDMGSFECSGIVSCPISMPVRTNLVPTVLYDDKAFEELVPGYNSKPVRLSPYYVGEERVCPMVEALRPYSVPPMAIDTASFSSAVFVAMRPFSGATTCMRGDVWSVEEAVIGRAGVASIPRKTSVGLPLCVEHKDKTFIVGNDEEYDITGPKFQKFRTEIINLQGLLQAGKRPWFVVRGFLKDEVRAPGKAARYISGTSIHYYVLCRMYFGEIVAAALSKFREHGMCTGINPYADWEWLHNFILRPGNKVWDGDFKGFDSSEQPQMLWSCLQFINSWYHYRGASDEDCNIRTILFLDLVKSRHVVGEGAMSTHVIEWQKSLPSGHFLTGFINSMVSMSCLVYAYIKLTGNYDFWDNCSAATQGDDNLCCANDKVVDRFNQVTVAKVLQEDFRMTYTAGRKGEELKPYVGIDDVIFLQRKFKTVDGKIVGPIRLQSCLCNMYWINKGDYKYTRETICGMAENNFCELSLHGKEVFLKGVSLLMPYLKRYSYVPLLDVSDHRAYFAFTAERDSPGF
jgi:hypothetical protein